MGDLPIDKLLGSTSEGSTVYGEDTMSELPTLYRQAWELNEHAPNAVYTVDHIGVYYEGYLVPVEEPLLSRVEAANDPEVQRIVIREWKNNAQWSGSSDHTGRER